MQQVTFIYKYEPFVTIGHCNKTVILKPYTPAVFKIKQNNLGGVPNGY